MFHYVLMLIHIFRKCEASYIKTYYNLNIMLNKKWYRYEQIYGKIS